MKKNYILFTTPFILLVLFILLIVRFMGVSSASQLKEMDILSDLKKDSPKPVVKHAPRLVVDKKQQAVSKGITCIEDYSKDGQAMLAFLQALDHSSSGNVRVAFLGDSFIEGDILTEDLREKLQQVFGGKGVGFIPATEELIGCRKTIVITSHDIASYWMTGVCNEKEVGINGSYYIPHDGASVLYKTTSYKKYIDTVAVARLMYLANSQQTEISCSVNGTPPEILPLKAVPALNLTESTGKIGRLRYIINKASGLKLFGTYLDGQTGVCVDNYAMRGNSGLKLLAIPESTLKQTDSLLNYRLVVLQYGLNACGETTTNYDWYTQKMNKAIEKIKRCFPHASVLLLGVGDRNMRRNGEYVTMPGIINLVEAQRQMAMQNGIAFWSIYDAMGGENSMSGYVKNGDAAKDFTHLSFSGGRKIGAKLFEALMFEKQLYAKKGLCKQ
jgi:hypothetical protein